MFPILYPLPLLSASLNYQKQNDQESIWAKAAKSGWFAVEYMGPIAMINVLLSSQFCKDIDCLCIIN